jgi:nucleotide-binding universal stress UspA family protein
MKKILVPIDFSVASNDALEIACQLADRTGARIFLIHVNEMATQAAPLAEYAAVAASVDNEAYDADAFDRLDDLRNQFLSKKGYEKLKISVEVREGALPQVLSVYTDEEEIDLVVTGTKGATGLKNLFLGSNTQYMIRNAKCPVLAIPQGLKELKIERVVVPSTLDEDQQLVFKVVKAWQMWFGFEIEAIYLNNPLNAPTDGSIEARKNKLIEAEGLHNVYVHIYGLTWKEDKAILTYAEEVDADLIIMGTHQRHGLGQMLFGSVTEETANHSHVPLLAIPIA